MLVISDKLSYRDIYKRLQFSEFCEMDLDDIWVRDYFPIYDRYRDVYYNYEGLSKYYVEMDGGIFCDLFLEGGNVELDEGVVVMTDKVFRINSHLSLSGVMDRVEKVFDRKFIRINLEWGDDLGHVDGIVRLLGGGRVMINDYIGGSRDYMVYRDNLIDIFVNMGYEVFLVPNLSLLYTFDLPDVVFKSLYPYSDDKNFAWGYYINFVEGDHGVYVPKFNVEYYDDVVYNIFKGVFNKEVYMVDCSHISMEGGLLNCITGYVKGDGYGGISWRYKG